MLIYYCITITANIAAAFIFHKSINITVLSFAPLFLSALMFFQAFSFKNEKTENGFRTAYGSNLTAEEENEMFDSGSNFLFAMIPWMLPFVIFFSSPVKVLSIAVYFIGLSGGLLLYKIKNKEKIIHRMNTEENERRKQEEKEQLGKWK